jgi:hypothetical protein
VTHVVIFGGDAETVGRSVTLAEQAFVPHEDESQRYPTPLRDVRTLGPCTISPSLFAFSTSVIIASDIQ